MPTPAMVAVSVRVAEPAAVALPAAVDGRVVFPLDLDAAEVCRAQKLPHEILPLFRDSGFYNGLWRDMAAVVQAAMADRTLFPMVAAPVNPLFILVHALIGLFGNAAIRVRELDALLAQAGDRPGCLVQAELPSRPSCPFIDTLTAARIAYGDAVTVLGDPPGPAALLLPVGQRRLRQRAIAAVRAGQRAWQRLVRPEAFDLDVVANDPEVWRDLQAANRGAGYPLRLHLVSGGEDFTGVTPDPAMAACLDRAMPRLAQEVAARLAMPSRERFAGLVDWMYRRWRDDLARAITLGTAGIADPPPASLEILSAMIGPRAGQYRRYLAGVRLVFQEFSDSEAVTISKVETARYLSAPIASASLYRGPYGVQQGEIVARHSGRTLPSALVAPLPFRAGTPSPSPRAPKLLYVPAAFSGHFRHGPTRETHDIVMWEAQQHILQVLGAVPGARVVYKAHPKDGFATGNRPIPGWQVDRIEATGAVFTKGSLADELKDADLVVSDYFGSGFLRCVQSGLPCVFLDFGTMEFYPEIAPAFHAACAYVPADFRHARWTADLAKAVPALLSGERRLDAGPFLAGLFGDGAEGSFAEAIALIVKTCRSQEPSPP